MKALTIRQVCSRDDVALEFLEKDCINTFHCKLFFTFLKESMFVIFTYLCCDMVTLCFWLLCPTHRSVLDCNECTLFLPYTTYQAL